ncbi:hypothetical protein FSP39_020068 [Pinctada imbricata]|uniref:G-protein coupled receptors family 1 profile domain-containing protein n=1 Tax=Pinctada imbricata TaxID=66713 RepID=A0AA89C5Q3_PINIB|nr:hypothetical protein FSP39_020068 [Pinctada imbricata]
MMQATFYNNSLCKAWWFFAALTTFMSGFSLVAIAVQRYLKVVRPLGRQMDLKLNRIALSLVFIISLLCAIPPPILYGSVPFQHAQEDIVGRRCSKIKGEYKAFSLMYGGLTGIFTITSIGALIGIYLRIGWTIFKHMKHGNRLTGSDEDGSTTKVTSVVDSKETSDHEFKSGKIIDPATDGKARVEKGGKKYVIQEKPEKGKKKDSTQNQHEKINRKIMHKFTLMFMLITTIFLICYIPKVFIMIVEALNPKFWETFDNHSRAGMLFVYRMYIINNISNPIVYAFLDFKFKTELKSLCRRK